MPLHKRTELKTVPNTIERESFKQVYLCFGERYLCQTTADAIIDTLLFHNEGGVHNIDGSTEDESTLLSRLLSFSLLPGLQIYRVTDAQLFLSKTISSEIWAKAVKAYQQNKPERATRHLLSLISAASLPIDPAFTLTDISIDQWQKVFGFAHPGGDINWTTPLLAATSSSRQPSDTDSKARFLSAIENGLPANNILIVATEHVDKRKKLFSHIQEHGEIIDCSVATGASRAALREQKDVLQEMVRKTLSEFNKTIEAKALELLCERVGFHPVAVVIEVEKLALFAENRPRITINDVDLLVARTREDALFQLTEALGNKDLRLSLRIFNNLTQGGIHTLAVLAAIRNYLRKLLIFRSFQRSNDPLWQPTMNASQFQNQYLPLLKEKKTFSELLKGHPYAVFMGFKKASAFSVQDLKQSLALVLEAEFRLKGVPIPPRLVLEELFVSIIDSFAGKRR